MRERMTFKALGITALVALLVGVFIGVFLVPTGFMTPLRNLLSASIAVPVEDENAPHPDAGALLGTFNEACSLSTVEYCYRGLGDTDTMSRDDLPWIGQFFTKRLLIKYEGRMKAGIELSQTNISIDDEKKSVTVVMPEPTVTDNYIVAGSEQVVLEEENLFNQLTEEERDACRSTWLSDMENDARAQGILDMASENAKKAIKDLAGSSVPEGYNVEVLTQPEYEQALAVASAFQSDDESTEGKQVA